MTQPPQGGTGKAFVSDASGTKTTAPQAFMQDKCFLCSRQIGESDPRQFYTGPKGGAGVMMLAHTGCLHRFMANGEVWPPQGEQQPEPTATIETLNSLRQAHFGKARLVYDGYSLALMCNREITEHGLKTVIPDLIVALRAIEESL